MKNPVVVVLVVILVLALVGGFHPSTTQSYGYWPGSGLTFVLVVLLILALMGVL